MKTGLETYQIILTILIFPFCIFLFVSFGWSAYATIAERPGLNGNMYLYYDLTRFAFASYTGLISLLSLLFILTIIQNVLNAHSKRLILTFKYFLVFIIVFVICGIYLQTRFVGKG